MIPALVLTAGLATRLRPLSRLRAKAALPVAREPLVQRIIRRLAAYGITDLVLNLHHLPETITAVVGDGSNLGVRVHYSWEAAVLGSAGGPRHALPLLGSPEFLIVNGDTLTDVDVRRMIDAHRRTGALVTMALVPNTEPRKYGGVLVGSDDVVTGFTKKGSAESSYHFIGVQAARAEAFAELPDNMPHQSVGGLYPALMRERPGSVRAFRCDAEFLDIGTPVDYLATSLLLAQREGQPSVLAGARAAIDPSASLEECVLWDDVVVEAGVRLRRCIVTDGVRVPAHTAWSEVTLRRAAGDLEPAETIHGALAVAALS